MKQEVIRELSTKDLIERLEEERKQMVKLRLNHAVTPLDNTNVISAGKKNIARLFTELKRRENEK